MKKNHFDGYIYSIPTEVLNELPELENFENSDFDDFKPVILVQKISSCPLKVFQVFLQLGDYSQQILYLPISNCQSVDMPNGEVFSVPYEETYDGIASYTLDLINSGKFSFKELIEYYKSNNESFDEFIKRMSRTITEDFGTAPII